MADESSTFKAEAKRDRSLDGTVGGVVGGEGKGGGGLNFGSGTKTSTTKNDTESSNSPGNANRKSGDSRSELAKPSPAKKSKPVTRPVVKAAPQEPSQNKDKVSAPKPPSERDTASPKDTKPTTTAPKPEPAPSADPAPPPPPPATGTGSTAEEKKPATPARGNPVGDDDDAAADKGENEAPAKQPADSNVDPATQAAALHKQAITAAKNNQCAKVKALGQTIRKLSSAYYDRTFLSDKKLTACLAPDVKK
jgi:hypothetical protein